MKTEEDIQKFIDNCRNGFRGSEWNITTVFLQIVYGADNEEGIETDGPDNWKLNDISRILSSRENADDFFKFFRTPNFVLYDNYVDSWISEQPEPLRKWRMRRWLLLKKIIDDVAKKYYNNKWGKQVLPELVLKSSGPKIPTYKPLLIVKTLADFKNNMINRPLELDGKIVGHIKSVERLDICVGYQSGVNSLSGDCPAVPKYETYPYSIKLWNRPEIAKQLYKKGRAHYFLLNSLEGVTIESDRVILKL